MSQQNLISVDFTAEEAAEINGLIATLKEKLEPKLKSLSPDDRRELSKMGEKTTQFVEKSLEYCSENEELAPRFLDVAEFERDYNSYKALRKFHHPISQLSEMLDDSMMLLGSDSYQAALAYYHGVKGAAKSNVANANTVYEDLSSRFPTGPRRKSSNDVE